MPKKKAVAAGALIAALAIYARHTDPRHNPDQGPLTDAERAAWRDAWQHIEPLLERLPSVTRQQLEVAHGYFAHAGWWQFHLPGREDMKETVRVLRHLMERTAHRGS